MSTWNKIRSYRNIITIALALSGIGLMVFYATCDTGCSYLKGDIFGIDLKWVGSAYMAALIVCAAFKQAPFVRILLAAGLGVEVFLFSFQVKNDVYCPFCLSFAMMVIAAFIINYEVPSAWRENRGRMWLYFLGEVDLPMLKMRKLPLLIFSLLGYLTICLTFSGSVAPAYAQDIYTVPSLGKGAYEVVLFTDYFCPPCRRIDTKAEPLFRKLLATGKVKITFADVPISKVTPIYTKYYLYSVNAGADARKVLRIRSSLFTAAQVNKIEKEDALVNYLKEQKIKWKAYNEKSVFGQLSSMIREKGVNQTPTCFIRYSATDIRKFVGDVEIWNGLTKLESHLAMGGK